MKSLTVISPVFNEGEVIEKFYSALVDAVAGEVSRYTACFLFVVDQCSDNTLEILRRLASQDPRVRVLALSSRFGHQAALLAGMDHAKTDAIIMLDSDLQHPPPLIPAMLREYEKGYDIVYMVRRDSNDIGFIKRSTSKLFYKLINLLSNVSVEESAADFRLISDRVARVFQNQIRERNQFLRGLFSWVGFRRIGIEFTVESRAGGRSKYSPLRLLRFAAIGIVSFSKRPLHAAIFIGIVFSTLGFGLSFITLIQYFTMSQFPSGWTTLVIIISIFSGINLFFLGVIGEYVGAIFDEVKGRPHYIVEEKVNF